MSLAETGESCAKMVASCAVMPKSTGMIGRHCERISSKAIAMRSAATDRNCVGIAGRFGKTTARCGTIVETSVRTAAICAETFGILKEIAGTAAKMSKIPGGMEKGLAIASKTAETVARIVVISGMVRPGNGGVVRADR